MSIKIFTNRTTDGESLAFIPSGSDGETTRNEYSILTVYGTFDSASLSLQRLKDGGNPEESGDWVTSGDSAITTGKSVKFRARSNVQHRLSLTSAWASTSITVELENGV